MSNHDGTAWGQSLMSGHEGFVNNNCQVCHAGGAFAPVTLNVGGDGQQGCVSCHGRTEDGPGQIGDGLRAHHMQADAYLNWPGGIPGGLTCAQCHPQDAVQVGEEVPPPRYPSLSWDPCADAQFGPDGLDNDGDGAYDGNDMDCFCGNGQLDGETEECDPSVEGTQCCNSDCTFNTGDPCEDDDLCTTGDTCDAGACMPGTPLTCEDDGNPCTFLECDPETGNCAITSPEDAGTTCGDPSDTDCDNPDTCDGAGACLDNVESSGATCGDPSDTDCDNPDTCDGAGTCLANVEAPGTSCDNGMFCDGADTCDDAGACQSAGDPCNPATETCNENADTCDPVTDPCGNGSLDNGEECDDGNTMDGDCCSATCQFEASGSACGDPSDTNCDNPDTCDGAGVCEPNPAADGTTCDDGDVCTANDACMTGTCMGDSLLGSEGPSGDPSCADSCDNDEDGAIDDADSGCQVVDPCEPNPCDDGNVCTDNVCTNVDGAPECTYPPVSDGTACGDPTSTECNDPDTCVGGTCVMNLVPDGTACGDLSSGECDAADTCLAGACETNTAADGTTCDDGDVCTANDACKMGTCLGDSLLGSEGPVGDSTCADSCDNDEDGAIDDADSGCQGVGLCAGFTPEETTCGIGECAATGMTTCDPATGEIGDTCTPGAPADELCNDLDDDCDDDVDEDFADLGMACTVGVGVCEVTGVYVCKADSYGLECDAVPGDPDVEGPVDDPTCSDGMDNDCDGYTDLDDVDCLDECDIVRAEVEAACPADHPWRNHGKYVSCAAKLVSRAVCDGRIDFKCAGEIVRDFARSDVGKKDKDDKSDDPSDDDDSYSGDDGDDDSSSNDDYGNSGHNNKNKDKAKNKSYDDDYCPADHIGDDDDHIVVADPIHVVGVVTNGGLVVLTDSPAFGSVHIVQPNEPGYPSHLDLPDHAIVLEYTIENVPPGATAQVTVDFPSGVTDPAIYKIVDGELRELDAVIGPDDTLTFTVTDGGWLDEDNKADGRIVDPVVIGQASSGSTTTQATAASSGGGGGGCTLGIGATPLDMLSLAAPLLFLLRLKRRK